ncbi:porin family protein [Zunongwangia sp. H14]|uniref:porin family protein n=1 Tax=Zunongwangia sp. H14 TaxID=3240792 RepID=UPI00356A556A
MKKLLGITSLLLLSINIYAQGSFGITGGIHASALSRGFLKSTGFHSNSFTFHFGGVYEKRISPKIAFRPKLMYSQQGDLEDYADNIQYETKYLNAALSFKFFSSPYLFAGLQIGYLLDTRKNSDDYGELRKLDYGALLGFGYDINPFFVELIAYQGINNLLEVNMQGQKFQVTNTTLGLSIGYFF